YRLTRTVWSGIRGGMEGSALAYGAKVFLYRIATVLTVLQLVPWASIRISERRINASSFGSAKFHFEGRAGQLYLPFLLTLLGTVVLFASVAAGVYWTVHDSLAPIIAALEANNLAGLKNREEVVVAMEMAAVVALIGLVVFSFTAALLACWYSATFVRHVVNRSTLAGCKFSSTITGRGLMRLYIGNFLIALF